jgi:hypothetical protein
MFKQSKKSLFLLLFTTLVPMTLMASNEFIEYETFQELPKRFKQQYLKNIKDLSEGLGKQNLKKQSFYQRELLENLETLLFSKAHADQIKKCFYAGWPSEMSQKECLKPKNSTYKEFFETRVYQEEKACQIKGAFICNPLFYGGPVCVSDPSEKACSENSKAKGPYAAINFLSANQEDLYLGDLFKRLYNQTNQTLQDLCAEASSNSCDEFKQKMDQFQDELGVSDSVELSLDMIKKIMKWELPIQLNEQCQMMNYNEAGNELNTILRSSKSDCVDPDNRQAANLYQALSFLLLDPNCHQLERIALSEDQGESCAVGLKGINQVLEAKKEFILEVNGKRTDPYSRIWINPTNLDKTKPLSANEWQKIIRTDPKNKDLLGKCFWEDEKNYREQFARIKKLKTDLATFLDKLEKDATVNDKKIELIEELKDKLGRGKISEKEYLDELKRLGFDKNLQEIYDEHSRLIMIEAETDITYEELNEAESELRMAQNLKRPFNTTFTTLHTTIDEIDTVGIEAWVSNTEPVPVLKQTKVSPEDQYTTFLKGNTSEIKKYDSGAEAHIFPSNKAGDTLPSYEEVKELISKAPDSFKLSGLQIGEDNISPMIVLKNGNKALVFRYKK